jgi:hypothetical protein
VIAVAAAGGILAVAFGIRALTGADSALSQFSGTALYAAMIYAGVYVPAPATRPIVAAVVALAFCWAVELSQLTGVPAALSERSLLARLALGVTFDPIDLPWYAVGVLVALAGHLGARRGPREKSATRTGSERARRGPGQKSATPGG